MSEPAGRPMIIKGKRICVRLRRIFAMSKSATKILSQMPLFVVAAIFTLLIFTGVSRADTGTWTQGELPILSLGSATDASQPPFCSPSQFTYSAYYTPNGTYSSTIREVTTEACVYTNGLGQFGNPGLNSSQYFEFIKPGTAYAYRVLDPLGRQKGLEPVPNQSTFVYADPIGLYGGSALRFLDGNFAKYGNFGVYGYGSGIQKQEIAYKMNSLPAWLKDASGNPILFNSWAYSSNGLWMVGNSDHGFIRVNTQTREMLVFSNKMYRYDLGFKPVVNFAISDDGMTVLNMDGDGGEVAAYDLSGCVPAPVYLSASSNLLTGCQKRALDNSLRAQVPGFLSIVSARFNADGKSVTGKLRRNVAPAGSPQSAQYYNLTYNVAGYQAPHTAYLGLGDSFSSGEGAFDYEQGTDETDPHNICHLSKKSYPYLAASSLGIGNGEFYSVACSGAKTAAYYAPQKGQEENKLSLLYPRFPGYRSQQRWVNSGRLDALTISMIGNDIGFSNKLKRCLMVADPCFHFREDRESIAQETHSKFETLVKLYQDLRQDSGGARIYVLGYPQLFSTTNNCAYNAPLDAEERVMSRGLVHYLNAVIQSAAANAGVQYIDVENAFTGHELCSAGQPGSQKAVNGLTAGRDTAVVIGNESFHPNALGHQLMAQALLAQSQNLERPMPDPVAGATAPYIGSEPYTSFVEGAPSGNILKRSVYITLDAVGDAADLALQTSPLHLSIPEAVKPSSVFEVWFNSAPVYAGSITSDTNGKLEGDITVPAGLTPGFHTLHIYGKNVAGETLDMARTVYVAASADDIDGDGVPNQDEQCLVGDAANIDYDRDSTDDACDPEITEPPAPPADTAPPVVTGSPDREPDHTATGWYTSDVTMTWTTTDPQPSSGTPTQPPPTVIAQEGEHEYTSEPSCDLAGNCSTGRSTVKLDKTAPTIDFQVSAIPSADGWYNQPVTVTFMCSDAVSGVASCSEPVTVDKSTVVTGYVTDYAGHTSGINAVIAIDGGKPSIRQTITPSPNAAGWHNTTVTVSATCEDNEDTGAGSNSGIAYCSPDTLINAEGSNQPVRSTAVDRAGNTAEATALINIDKTAPVLGALLWSANPKVSAQTSTVTVAATDNLSGIAEAEYFLGDTDPGQGNGASMYINPTDGTISTVHGTDFPTGVYKVSVRAKDAAGNWSPAVSDYLVVYNPTGIGMTGKQTITPSLANGDVLPGLVADGQTDPAKFGFSVRYDSTGHIHKTSDFQFSYRTGGTKCSKPPYGQTCHNFELNATSIAWLATQGSNNSTGIFQGVAKLVIDGTESIVQFRLTGVDGERLSSTAKDQMKLGVYRFTDNPNTAMPLYRVSGAVERGNIHIRTGD